MTNDILIIEELATELSKLDREKDSERIRAIESEICAYELGILKNIKGKAFFPLLGNKSGTIPYDDFHDILTDVLLKLLRNYNPEKAKFSTALMYIVQNRLKDYYTSMRKKAECEESLDARLEIMGDAGDFAVEVDFMESLENKTELKLFLEIAHLIAIKKEKEKHFSIRERSLLEGFFTFDTAAQIKHGLFDEKEVISNNDSIFPIMELVVLEYLLEGAFDSMYDVVYNAVRDEKRLRQRNKTMQVCYNLSKPTVSKKFEKYIKLFEAFGLKPKKRKGGIT